MHWSALLISGGSTCAPITFLLVDQSSPNFLHNAGGVVIDQNAILIFDIPIQQLKSEVAWKRANFCTFLASQIFGVLVLQNLFCCHAYLAARHTAKFHGITPLTSKAIGMHSLHSKPIFDSPFVKKSWGTTVHSEVCAS